LSYILFQTVFIRSHRFQLNMGRRKRKSAPKSSLCSVCQSTYQLSTSSILPCSLHIVSSPHTICDLCLYRHIFTVLSKDVTSSVICPIQGCDDVIPNDIIQPILLKFNINLSEEYTLKFNWRGTSEQWIKRFTARCPGCSVPIEKNGGCNQVVCQRCRQVFDWQRAKNSNLYRMQTRYRTLTSPVMAFFCRLFIVALVILLVVLCLIYTEKLLLIGDSLLRYLTYFSKLSPIILFK
jgi:hypothetical protein